MDWPQVARLICQRIRRPCRWGVSGALHNQVRREIGVLAKNGALAAIARDVRRVGSARAVRVTRTREADIATHEPFSCALHAPHVEIAYEVPTPSANKARFDLVMAVIGQLAHEQAPAHELHPLVRLGIRQQLVGGHERGGLRPLPNLLGALYNARVLSTTPSTSSPPARSRGMSRPPRSASSRRAPRLQCAAQPQSPCW